MESKPQSEKPLIFEMVEKTSNVNDFVLRPVTGSEAFRRFNVFLGPALNKSNNLRGMVVNARMRSIYKLSGNVGEKLAVVSALIEVAKEYSKIQTVYNSENSNLDKTSHITLLTSAAVLRGVTSIVPTAVHYTLLSAEGYAMLLSLLTGNQSGNALAAKLDAADQKVTEIHSQQWNGEVWYKVITGTVH